MIRTRNLSILVAALIGAAPLLLAQKLIENVHPNVRLFIPYSEYSQEDNDSIRQLFEGLRVSDVSDAMDMVGLTDVGTVSPDIKALWRDTEEFTHRITGIAVTARYVPTNQRVYKITDEQISQWYSDITSEAFQEVLFAGAVLVIDAHEDGESRSIGSTNIRGWQSRGMVGVVTSGGLADSDEIIHHKVPAYYARLARGIRPGRNELESVNRPVTIGGALVRPGDVIVADGDGVIVVPREHAEAVAAAAVPFLDNIGRERYERLMEERKKRQQ